MVTVHREVRECETSGALIWLNLYELCKSFFRVTQLSLKKSSLTVSRDSIRKNRLGYLDVAIAKKIVSETREKRSRKYLVSESWVHPFFARIIPD